MNFQMLTVDLALPSEQPAHQRCARQKMDPYQCGQLCKAHVKDTKYGFVKTRGGDVAASLVTFRSHSRSDPLALFSIWHCLPHFVPAAAGKLSAQDSGITPPV